MHNMCSCTFNAIVDGCLEYVISGSSYDILFEVKFRDYKVMNFV